MADRVSPLDLIATAQAQKEVTANNLFNAASPTTVLGRRASTSTGLTWGYYGGATLAAGGAVSRISSGTITLADNATNYVEWDPSTPAVAVNSTGWTTGFVSLYLVTTVSGAVTEYEDWRVSVGAAYQVPAGTAATLDFDIDDTLAADSDALIPTQQAVKGYVDAAIAGVGSGSGDVVGPASAVDSSVALFDGTTGKLIKDSGLTLSGSNSGDQTSVTGNAGTATALQTARTIGGTSFDGTANITQPFDVLGYYPGVPTASAKVVRVPVARAVTFAANLAGSYGIASVAATASTAFDVAKNGTSVGTITFAAAATTATFVTAGGTSFSLSAGDRISITAPATPDATLADPGFVLAGTR